MNVDATGKARGVLSPEVRDLSVGDEGSVITSIETYALAVPLARPIADATAAMSHWTVPVVEVRTADGRVGTGISGVHCGPELLCDVIENYYAQALLGASSQDISATWKRLYWLPTHWIGRAGVVHMALDLASLTDQGWRRVKMKVGKPDWREDARRVRAVRNQLGDDVTLMCDANQRWDLATASRIMPVLEEAQLDWVEEPRHLRGPAADRVHPLDARRVHPPQRHP
jgi:L-alanine-DL-glutamate epimerase-like enolase superfamily enzyme